MTPGAGSPLYRAQAKMARSAGDHKLPREEQVTWSHSQEGLNLIIMMMTGPGDHGAQEGPGQDTPGSPEDSIPEAESGQQKQQ